MSFCRSLQDRVVPFGLIAKMSAHIKTFIRTNLANTGQTWLITSVENVLEGTTLLRPARAVLIRPVWLTWLLMTSLIRPVWLTWLLNTALAGLFWPVLVNVGRPVLASVSSQC